MVVGAADEEKNGDEIASDVDPPTALVIYSLLLYSKIFHFHLRSPAMGAAVGVFLLLLTAACAVMAQIDSCGGMDPKAFLAAPFNETVFSCHPNMEQLRSQ